MKTASQLSVPLLAALLVLGAGCSPTQRTMEIEVYETSAAGRQLSRIDSLPVADLGATPVEIALRPGERYQEILGFGGSFTEASAYLLNQLSRANRERVIDAYFGEEGARYSLTRTHMNSCDFSLSNYSYAPVEGDVSLEHFSIDEDREDIIPFIRDAMARSAEGFRIISSPWTAPPWMKDNQAFVGGKLLPEYYDSWALFFAKYIDAYRAEGIDIWGVTVENEPLGNGNNWESMHFTPAEMTRFVADHLGPRMEAEGHGDVQILGYDQNREHLREWVDAMYDDPGGRKYFDGTAIHWYASTFEVFPDALEYARAKAPEKLLIQTEACVDAEVPHWQDDNWYWTKEATDWGWDWAPEEDKHLHPKYVPVYRYARDIIGCLNYGVSGWVDWNMVLDRQGGPNWFKNWCVAPVIVDPAEDEVYFTPLYYTMAHFSRFIRPGATRIGFGLDDTALQVTAAENPDGSLAVVVFNPGDVPRAYHLRLGEQVRLLSIDARALQTVVVRGGE